MKYDYDVIVIGGGTAGLAAYREVIKSGKTALLIESTGFTTTCASVGCMPSKLLIAASHNAEQLQKSYLFGIKAGEVSIDGAAIFERVRRERDRFVGFVQRGAENIEHKIIGTAHLIDNNRVEVNGEVKTCRAFVLACGSRNNVPNVLKDINYLTNESVFELRNIPKTMAIIGAGVIGLEMGYAFKNLGSQIHLFSKHERLLGLNASVSDYLVKDIKENFNFLEEDIKKVTQRENDYLIEYGDKSIIVEQIFVAIGRTSNIDKLGVPLNMLKKYNRQTTQIEGSCLFVAGDANGDIPVLHEAANEAIIAAKNAISYPHVREFKRSTPLAIVFTQPQVMTVGQTDKYYIKGEVSFEDQGRSRVELVNKGLLELYFTRERQLIGAQMIGPSAEHIAHSLCWLIEKGVTLEEFLDMPFYHPVIEEGVRTALRDARDKFSQI